MKKIIPFALICFTMLVQSAFVDAQDGDKYAMADELLTLMKMQSNIEESFSMAKNLVMSQSVKRMHDSDDDAHADISSGTANMLDVIMNEFKWEKVKDEYISLYADAYTEEELAGIIAFYKTPAGQAFANKSPDLGKRAVDFNQARMAKIMPQIKEMIREQRKSLRNQQPRAPERAPEKDK
ncbi:MAG: hypothetical protein BWY26_00474 [Elusimicrobia bacterium ADurb.Bin231]|nr:MAG: hypothetical protein BWY26_00474 [Elusimicrobia bacterium ADurb.Bin231]